MGGARTAIFNWLYAKRHGGVFVLRIEDTDAQRSSDEVVRAILDGMAWLGMAPDEGPFFQTRNRAQHVADAMRLLAEGKAYRCFCAAEALAAEREAAEKAGGGYVYARHCLPIPRAESDRRAAGGAPFVVRLKVPDGETAWDDGVHGTTSFPNAVIEDLILLRTDRTPTYNLSVVSDDVAMRITHVIRGYDHISTTPKQILIYAALGEFACLAELTSEPTEAPLEAARCDVGARLPRAGLPDAMFNFWRCSAGTGDGGEDVPHELTGALTSTVGKAGRSSTGQAGAAERVYIQDLGRGLRGRGACPDGGILTTRTRGTSEPGRGALLQPRSDPPDPVEGRFFFDPSDELDYDPPAPRSAHGLLAALRARSPLVGGEAGTRDSLAGPKRARAATAAPTPPSRTKPTLAKRRGARG